MQNLETLTVASIRAGLRSGEFTAVRLAEAALSHGEETNPQLGAYLSFTRDRAIRAAKAVDSQIAEGRELGPLAGVPLAVKDVLVTEGDVTTCASRLLEHYRPPYTATAVARAEAAGAVVIGKANCDEFAMGSSNENSAYFPARNPADPERVPGGSSGGSAVAVAGGSVPLALGSDTGGSIRQPASFCGVVGVLPTYGRVSRYGLVAFASSLDHVGPFARNVEDAATLLEAISGRDPYDSTSAEVPVGSFTADLDVPAAGTRVGVPKEYFTGGLDAAVRERIDAGLKDLQAAGCELVDVSLPHTEYAVATYYLICTAEASANLARYDGVRYTTRSTEATDVQSLYAKTRDEGFGIEVKRRIILGTYVLSAGYYDAYYRKAQKVRSLIAKDFGEAFENVDAIATPVCPTPAFRLGEKTSDPLEMYLADIYTLNASLAGIPGISVPCGETSGGLPVGLQLLTPHFEEARLLRLARAFEKQRDAAA